MPIDGRPPSGDAVCPISGDAVPASSEQPPSGILRGSCPALGPRPLLAALRDKLRDSSSEHCLRWTHWTPCVCKFSFSLDRPCEQARGSHQESVKANSEGRRRPVSLLGRALPAPWGPCWRREDGGGVRLRAGVSDSRCPGPVSGLSSFACLLCFWALQVGWAGRHHQVML